jgi:hypothetical protein
VGRTVNQKPTPLPAPFFSPSFPLAFGQGPCQDQVTHPKQAQRAIAWRQQQSFLLMPSFTSPVHMSSQSRSSPQESYRVLYIRYIGDAMNIPAYSWVTELLTKLLTH